MSAILKVRRRNRKGERTKRTGREDSQLEGRINASHQILVKCSVEDHDSDEDQKITHLSPRAYENLLLDRIAL
ncbi:hypothetical protein B9Z55_023723 [Caenorhabditis nigoni]|uniref:Uncharacterized protein n=1 Tax=Caenorhabditis nigoni TaxID=1611254 RepID=A0A2G5SQX3_9PELO|nr:hypothetical protein B9Z55_023723 [Caenorhabditis nigoni]